MDSRSLQMDNMAFAGTCGVSEHATVGGFSPAFLDKASGRVEVSRMRDGQPAPAHLISWLPREWAAEMEADGAIVRLRAGIIAGFVKDGVFLTREQAAEL